MGQLVVSVMHRSDTSLIDWLLSMLCLHMGGEYELLAPQPAKPKGFFELGDVFNINSAAFSAKTELESAALF